MHKELKILATLVLSSVSCFADGLVNPSITPSGGGGGGNTNGQSAAQVATQIRQTNDTILANLYINSVSGSGSGTTLTGPTLLSTVTLGNGATLSTTVAAINVTPPNNASFSIFGTLNVNSNTVFRGSSVTGSNTTLTTSNLNVNNTAIFNGTMAGNASGLTNLPISSISTNTAANGQVLTVGSDGQWHGSNASSGGASFPAAAYDGQTYISLTNTTIVTNINAAIGLFTNGQVSMIGVGDSIMAGFNAFGGLGMMEQLTNLYLPSNWREGTNAGVASTTTATITTGIPSVLTPWASSGTTNLVFLYYGGLNDILTGLSPSLAVSNINYGFSLAKASNNCVTVGFTIMGSQIFQPDGVMYGAWRDFNQIMKTNCPNCDYLVEADIGMPPPGDYETYKGDTQHPYQYKRLSALIYDKLTHGRKNQLPPKAAALPNLFENIGSFTPFGGAYALGWDCVFAGVGTTPSLHLGTSGNQLFTIWPDSSLKNVGFYYNDSASTWSGNTLMMQFQRMTNVYFPNTASFAKGIITITNSAVAPASITFPNTTVKWTNTMGINIVLYVNNTGVTSTGVLKNGTAIFSGAADCFTLLFKPGDYFSETYSAGTPQAKWEPQ